MTMRVDGEIIHLDTKQQASPIISIENIFLTSPPKQRPFHLIGSLQDGQRLEFLSSQEESGMLEFGASISNDKTILGSHSLTS